MFFVLFFIEGSEEQAKTADAETEGDEEEAVREKPKKLPNQFNFCERASLTYQNLTRVKMHLIKLNLKSSLSIIKKVL